MTGAYGIAILTHREMKGEQTRFIHKLEDRIKERKVRQCKGCSNLCNIISTTYNDGQHVEYGGICGKYDKDMSKESAKITDYFALRSQK